MNEILTVEQSAVLLYYTILRLCGKMKKTTKEGFTMKKRMIALLLCCMVLGGCGSQGVPQEDYDRVVAERNELQRENERLQKNYDAAVEDLASLQASIAIEGIKSDVESEQIPDEKQVGEKLEDFQEPEPFFTYSGTGDDIVSGAKTESASYAHITHEKNGHFSVKGYYGDDSDLLINTTDSYDGTTLLFPNQEYRFEVSAKGDWTIELYKIGTSSTDSFSGNGDCVTPIFLKTSDVYEITTNGGGHFSIKGWGNNDYKLLVNTTEENYSGKVMFNSKDDYAFFEIKANREWEIKPSE